ncbi:lysophospholipid acyltransferase family protein [Lutispora thermophila]|uniref:1-acyl-sn-glycerol-3-phosphate acyltransferase n=1 Tax=Lutispora thermophila DSM 19022 TaxID=1122184 RepID=A0A1M6F845_9FIRM|nr:lysophospholipid acyltransferase family protein [Lutispora thermophila]SHI93887.1 1-acyl-sn-glycerol-3-phosphate acyltransferase [Lutispora thermophila DSM 19022]
MLYNIAKFLLKPIFNILYAVKVDGMDNLPLDNGYIVCGNHAKAVDPILIAINLPSKINFMGKSELFSNKIIGYILSKLGAFPVKRGQPDLKSIKTSLKLLQEKQNIGIFPEGTRNRTDELIAEPGIAMLAIKSRSPIVPITIQTNYKFFNRTTINIGNTIFLDEYFDKKLKNEDYINISLDIMKKIKK